MMIKILKKIALIMVAIVVIIYSYLLIYQKKIYNFRQKLINIVLFKEIKYLLMKILSLHI